MIETKTELLGKKRNACRVLAGKPKGNALRKPRYKWKDIKLDLGEMGWGVSYKLDSSGSG
jgi:hypothetical protein